MTESDEVEEILYEAHYLGVKNKVMEKANDWIKRKKMPKGVAYRRALDRYKKEGKIEIGSSGTFYKGKTPSNK
jgi:hypothetical protein